MKKKQYSDVDFEMFTMPFGTHKNKTLAELPASYMLWIVNEDFCPPVLKAYVELHEEELQDRSQEEYDPDENGFSDY